VAKRAFRLLAVGYVVAGLVALALERAGMYRCACDSDCWCQRPGLNVFRWIVPRFHHISMDAPNKQTLD
jgi:hypothetical protein